MGKGGTSGEERERREVPCAQARPVMQSAICCQPGRCGKERGSWWVIGAVELEVEEGGEVGVGVGVVCEGGRAPKQDSDM